MVSFSQISDCVIGGKVNLIKELTHQALKEGFGAGDILKQALVAGMDVVGERFKNCQVYIPEVFMSARAMQESLNILKPHLSENAADSMGRIVIGTVKGDLHDIGKNLVAMMMEGAGFEVIDLGSDVAPQRFVEVAKEKRANVVAMSALLTTTMPRMKETLEGLKKAGLEKKVKTLIGGAVISPQYAEQIGADAYGHDASTAVEKAKILVQQSLEHYLPA